MKYVEIKKESFKFEYILWLGLSFLGFLFSLYGWALNDIKIMVLSIIPLFYLLLFFVIRLGSDKNVSYTRLPIREGK